MRRNKDEKEVYKFTDNAIMKFRPEPYLRPQDKEAPAPTGMVGKVTALFSGLFASRDNRPEG